MGKIIPILMLLMGIGAGVGAGLVLAPPAGESETASEGDMGSSDGDGSSEEGKDGKDGGEKMKKSGGSGEASAKSGDDYGEDPNAPDFVKLNNQFVVPVVTSGRVEALVVLTLSLETGQGLRENIYSREPKLRDAFLQVLFDHSNMGGFQGAFTRSNNLDVLRGALLEVAQNQFGDDVYNVLIVDIARQDV